MYFEPENDEEELFALRGALSGTKTPTGCMGALGLLGSGLMVLGGVSMLTMGGPAAGVGVMYLFIAVLYAIAPGLLAASAMQSPKDLDDSTAAVRQARILMVFWWLAAVMTLGTLVLYFFAFLLAFGGMAAFL